MSRNIGNGSLLVALLVMAACSGNESDNAAEEPAAAADTAMSGMQGMPGMPGMEGGDMMAKMNQHMSMMKGVDADSMRAMMPAHRQMAGNMLSEMSRQMETMKMPADAAWNALTDSVRTDLTRLAELKGPDLQALMKEHDRRMMRMMDQHKAMMKTMGM